MAFHTVAFSANMVSVNVGTFVTPVVDNTVTINGNNLLVPAAYTNIFAAAPFATASSTVTSAQLQAPSLREVFYPNLMPVALGATFVGIPNVWEAFDNPVPLEVNEGLNYYSDALLAAPSGQQGCVAFLSDGPRQPVKGQKIYTMKATAAVTCVVNSWVNGPLTFNQTLPVGNYDVVGMRAEGVGLYAARLNFIGASATTRPGCPGVAAISNIDLYDFRAGRLGVWGTFNSLTPPSVDFFGGTSTTQAVYLDLVQR